MIEKYTLSNGIPVFIVESHSSPVVSIQAWITRGSAYESDELAGISHFLEHALFKGTKRRKVGEIAKEIESRGGEINAFTSYEETAYYTTLASRYFEEGLDVIADAVQNPTFDPDEMKREKEVILEEIKRAFDSPARMVSRNLWSTCYKGTPFGRPVLGFEKTVRKIDAKRLKGYYQKNYHANSLAVFIVGDVTKEQALKLARKKFGKFKKGSRRKLPPIVGKSSRSVKIIPVGRDIKECQIQLGIPGPDIKDPMIPALDMMCTAIGQGESSRLYQSLVKEKHLALDIQMGLVATGKCSMITIAMVVPPDLLYDALIETMAVLTHAAETGLEDHELERVKNSLESDTIASKETVENYARRLGYYYCQFGAPDYEEKYFTDILAITSQQATNSLQWYLKRKPVVSLAHPMDFKVDTQKIIKALSFASIKPKKQKEAALGLKEINGIRFVSKPLKSLPLLSIRLIFQGGTKEETANEYGISHLFRRVWNAGTTNYTCLQIANTLESIGASISGFSGKNSIGLDVECLSKHWPIVKPLLTEILSQPTFPEKELETERALILRSIASEKDSPASLCQMNYLELLYPGHCQGRSVLGTKDTVNSLTRNNLQSFFEKRINRKGLVVSSVGALTSSNWDGELSEMLSHLPESGQTPLPEVKIEEPDSHQVVSASKTPLFQSHLVLGFLGGSFSSPERYALKLLSSCLAGQGGRLFLELRDKQSLAYTVVPMNSDGPVRGTFAFYIGCSPEKLQQSIVGIRCEIEKLLDKPISNTELKRAKQYWIGRYEVEMQKYSTQAGLFGLDEFYGFGYEHGLKLPKIINSVTPEEIQKAAQKFFLLDRPTISVVHPTLLDRDEVLKYWNQN